MDRYDKDNRFFPIGVKVLGSQEKDVIAEQRK
jgi:hypothetical protein